jgi:hypothetical protein
MAVDVLLGVLDARLTGGRSSPGAARAIGLAAAAAVVVWLPLGALIFLSNVVFPGPDNAISLLAGYLYLMTAFVAIGAAASRACVQPWSWPVAGAAAGVVMATLINGTFAWVDNAFLDVVSQQPQKIADFHASGMTSWRAFIDLSLERQVLGITIEFTVFAVLFGTLGAVAAARRRLDRAPA